MKRHVMATTNNRKKSAHAEKGMKLLERVKIVKPMQQNLARSTYNGSTTNHRKRMKNHNPNNTDPSRISSQAKHRYWNSNSLSNPCCTDGEFFTSSCVKSKFCVLFIQCESNKNDGIRTISVFAIIGDISVFLFWILSFILHAVFTFILMQKYEKFIFILN